MSTPVHRRLPEAVAREAGDAAERDALEHVWHALSSAQPAPTVDAASRAALWAAIAAETTPDSRAHAVTLPPPALAPSRLHGASATRLSIRRGSTPAWATRLVRSAALAALVVVVGWLSRPAPWETIAVPRAAQQQLTLADGSRVDLDAGSTLRYRRDFRGWFGRQADRQVQLDGTAYFAIARDGRAFEVRTYNATVRVLGTSFSVKAHREDSSGTAVAVAEGRVALGAGDEAHAVELGAEQRATVAHASLEPGDATHVALDRVAPWRSGGFVAFDESLLEVSRMLSRRFDASIFIASPEIAARRVTAYFPEAVTLDRVLSDLATMQDLRLERQADGYVLR